MFYVVRLLTSIVDSSEKRLSFTVDWTEICNGKIISEPKIQIHEEIREGVNCCSNLIRLLWFHPFLLSATSLNIFFL